MSPIPLPSAPPVLSTPDTHIFESPTPTILPLLSPKSPEKLTIIYEIQRTISEIRGGKWKRIALQFPDSMLGDAPRVFELLRDGLRKARIQPSLELDIPAKEAGEVGMEIFSLEEKVSLDDKEERLYILADTSYGACCVDEVAAEHVDADVVVHYGRSCLSPTARLPVIYVFTKQELEVNQVVNDFRDAFQNKEEKVVLMTDVTFTIHITDLHARLVEEGYKHIFCTAIVHAPSSLLPNRTVPNEVGKDIEKLKEWRLFHVGVPQQSLLLTLASRFTSIHIHPISNSAGTGHPPTLLASTAVSLRRRYALLTSLATVPIFGILINTLSVRNYLHIVEHVKAKILAAGKKSYTFVVGKVNAAKVANFSEIGGWVVIGCWESSLIESQDFWKPLITPFELELALEADDERIWTGEWRSDFQDILDKGHRRKDASNGDISSNGDEHYQLESRELDSEEESAPPEFDLRSGRYISHSRPIGHRKPASRNGDMKASSALVKRAKGDLAVIGGEMSPGAEFLRSKRTWKGLGSDFQIAYDEDDNEPSTAIEEGRSGIARGYRHGESPIT